MARRSGIWLAMGVAVALGLVASSGASLAFCGCDKPPPPLARIRPAFGYADQAVTLFDERLAPGDKYRVVFTSRDGTSDWSQSRAARNRDLADAQLRRGLRVSVPDLPLGPASLAVYDKSGALVYRLPDDEFTVIASPVALHDTPETITEEGYRAGVGADGTVYLAFDLSRMSDATIYEGVAEGYDLRFDGASVAIFNIQGFLGEVLEPDSRGLFRLTPAATGSSTGLTYWRHEFRTYKEDHRKRDDRMTIDGEWHADGSRHVDNDHLVVAIAGALADGRLPQPGATPPFRLVITSTPAPINTLK